MQTQEFLNRHLLCIQGFCVFLESDVVHPLFCVLCSCEWRIKEIFRFSLPDKTNMFYVQMTRTHCSRCCRVCVEIQVHIFVWLSASLSLFWVTKVWLNCIVLLTLCVNAFNVVIKPRIWKVFDTKRRQTYQTQTETELFGLWLTYLIRLSLKVTKQTPRAELSLFLTF